MTLDSGQFRVRRQTDAQGVVLALGGELDLASAGVLEDELRKTVAMSPDRILIDLRCLGFMDATGIALLIRAQQSAHANGHRLELRRGPHQVQRLFELTGLLHQFVFLD